MTVRPNSPDPRAAPRHFAVDDLPSDRPLVVFDGVCNLCDGLVRFIMDRDAHGRFLFTPLQSDFARELLARNGLDAADMDSVVFVYRDQFHIRADAIAGICELLPGVWRYGALIRKLPLRVRNVLYHFVARNRYRLFGRRAACRLPRPDEAARFIE